MAIDPQGGAARLNELLAGEASLDRVLAVIATIDEQAPPEQAIVDRFDQLAAGLPGPTADTGSDTGAGTGDRSATVDTVLGYVFGDLGFAGDSVNYYSPANSLIHRVLERRRGIPLSLAAVAVEIGRRHGIDLRLVGLPGHVLLGQGSTPQVWFDPFSDGARLGRDDCRRLFAQFHPIEAFQETMLAPIDATMVAVRVLNNLHGAYARRGDTAAMVPLLSMRAELPIAGPGDRLELARALVAVGRFDQAADQFEWLIELDPNRAEAYRAKVNEYRAHRN